MNSKTEAEKPKRFKSCARWEHKHGFQDDMTTDEHDTKAQALAVCEVLKRDGLGGERIHFPIDTWVEPVTESALRSLLPQEPVRDKEALGKRLFEIQSQFHEYNPNCTWQTIGELNREERRIIATQFALSIQNKEGVCVWIQSLGRDTWFPRCRTDASFGESLKSQFKFCPFCSKEIQEQGGLICGLDPNKEPLIHIETK